MKPVVNISPAMAPATSAGSITDRRRKLIVAVMGGCAALVFSLGASLNLAIGRIATSALHPGATEILWIIDTYLVVFGCLLIPAGALGDRLGRKQSMLTGLGLLAAGSLLSALAANVAWLLGGRAIAGAGAALILPNSLALLVQIHPPEQKPHAIATWTAMTGLGGALGNVLGGLVMEFADWQAIFAVALPLAAVGFGLTAWLAPRQPVHARPVDAGGAVILMLAVFALLAGLIEGQELSWTSPRILASFGAALLMLFLFLRTAANKAHPLLDPRVLRLPVLGASMLGIVASFVGMYAMFYLNGQYLMSVKGYSPLRAGLSILPLVAVVFWVSPRSVRLSQRLGMRGTVGLGLGVLIAGLGLLMQCDAASPYWQFALSICVVGIGSGLSNPVLSSAIVGALPAHQAGVGAGINSFTREIGGALGVALCGSLMSGAFAAHLPPLWSAAPEPARQTIGAALAYAASHPALSAQAAAVRHAFSLATGHALAIVMVVLFLSAAALLAWLPSRRMLGVRQKT